MANYFPDEALLHDLTKIIADRLNGASLCAFTTNHAPASGDTLATYTAIEASFGGYARITLNSWGAASINVGGAAETDEIERVWTATGSGLPVTIYGIFIIGADGFLAYAELNPTGGVTLSAAGHQFPYTPKRTHSR